MSGNQCIYYFFISNKIAKSQVELHLFYINLTEIATSHLATMTREESEEFFIKFRCVIFSSFLTGIRPKIEPA